jgi:hypothetical protein
VTDTQILYIFVEIFSGRRRHGSFLTSFAEAVTRADPSNFAILREAAIILIAKYELSSYLNKEEGVPG